MTLCEQRRQLAFSSRLVARAAPSARTRCRSRTVRVRARTCSTRCRCRRRHSWRLCGVTGEGAWEARGWRRTPRRCRTPPVSVSDTSRRTVSEATWPCYFETRAWTWSNYINIKVSRHHTVSASKYRSIKSINC